MNNKILLSIYLIIFSFFIVGPASSAHDDRTQMMPLNSERLDNKIYLSECEGLNIIEWRPTPGKVKNTSPNKKSINIINNICELVFSEYPSFIQKEGYSEKRKYLNATRNSYACLMPADINDHGLDFRNLNDNDFRFKNRKVNGVEYFWGYYDYKYKTVFMANDPIDENGNLNENFQTVFAHELYHMISHYTEIYSEVGPAEEERMAKRFTTYIGLD